MINLDDFQRDGYQMIPAVFEPAQVRELRSWLEAQMDLLIEKTRDIIGAKPDENLSNALQRFYEQTKLSSLKPDVKDSIAGQFPLQVRLDEPLRKLLKSARLREVLGAVFPGQKLRAHMPPMARFVIPRHPLAAVPAHQDISYNKHLSDFVTGWVPLVDIDDQCGGVRIHHGTAGLPEQLKSSEPGLWLPAVQETGSRKVDFHMKAGDLLLFAKSVIHESRPNISNATRLSIDYRFFGDQAVSSKHYLDMETWEVIAPPSAPVSERAEKSNAV